MGGRGGGVGGGSVQGFWHGQERRNCMKNEELKVCRNTKINLDSAELTGCLMQSKIKLGTIAQFTTEAPGGGGKWQGGQRIRIGREYQYSFVTGTDGITASVIIVFPLLMKILNHETTTELLLAEANLAGKSYEENANQSEVHEPFELNTTEVVITNGKSGSSESKSTADKKAKENGSSVTTDSSSHHSGRKGH
ncbi:hypothetical protein Tco_0191609 [Tanacetum coccineum]